MPVVPVLEPALVPVGPAPEEMPPVVPVLEAALLPEELEAAAVVEPAALSPALEEGPPPAEDEMEMAPWQPAPAAASATQSLRVGSLCITPDRARQVEAESDARRANEAML